MGQQQEHGPQVNYEGSGRDRKAIVQLADPVDFGEERVQVLEVPKPRGKQMKKVPLDISQGDMERLHPLAADLIQQPTALLDELDADDYLAVMGAVANFIGSGPETGAAR